MFPANVANFLSKNHWYSGGGGGGGGGEGGRGESIILKSPLVPPPMH